MPPPPSVPPSAEVNALVELYQSTEGENWRNSSGWLSGSPCADEWRGIVCCPATHPTLRSLDPRECVDDNGDPPPQPMIRGAAWPDGCASNSSTGLAAYDREYCRVAAVVLPSNGLRGVLPASLSLLELQAVDVGGNALEGEVPSWVLAVTSEVRLDENDFSYDASSETLRALFSRCRTDASLVCEGFPPQSCAAFDGSLEVKLDDATRCVSCDDGPLWPVLSMFLLLLLFVGGLAGYLWLIARHPAALKQWVTTLSLLIAHMQTVSTLTTLRLEWPSSVRDATRYTTFMASFLDLGVARPECVLGSVYYGFQLVRGLAVLLLLLGVSLLQGLLKLACGREMAGGPPRAWQAVDRLELAESIVFQVQWQMMWRVIFELLDAGALASGDATARAAAATALLLLFFQAFFLLKYLLNVRALVTGESCGPFARLPQPRLQTRLAYLTRRFASHAPYWQFVIWARQWLLILDGWMTRSLVMRVHIDDSADVYAMGNSTNFTNITMGEIDGSSDDGSIDASSSSSSSSSNTNTNTSNSSVVANGTDIGGGYDVDLHDDRDVILAHTMVAVLCLLVAAALHVRVQPFEYRMQNVLETCLFGSDVLLVLVATAYSVTDPRHVGGRACLEALLVLIVVGTFVMTYAFLAAYRRDMQRAQLGSAPAASAAGRAGGGGDKGLGLGVTGEPERRMDGGHGPFTEQEFLDYYGEEEGLRRWAAAAPDGAPPSTTAPDDGVATSLPIWKAAARLFERISSRGASSRASLASWRQSMKVKSLRLSQHPRHSERSDNSWGEASESSCRTPRRDEQSLGGGAMTPRANWQFAGVEPSRSSAAASHHGKRPSLVTNQL